MAKSLHDLSKGNPFCDASNQQIQFKVSITAPDGTVYEDDGVLIDYVDPGVAVASASMADHSRACVKRRWNIGLTKQVELGTFEVFGK